jgi:hypothetical protein
MDAAAPSPHGAVWAFGALCAAIRAALCRRVYHWTKTTNNLWWRANAMCLERRRAEGELIRPGQTRQPRPRTLPRMSRRLNAENSTPPPQCIAPSLTTERPQPQVSAPQCERLLRLPSAHHDSSTHPHPRHFSPGQGLVPGPL